ncbi:MAG: hypothetical protein ACLTKT_04130 [Clostridia bacterium]|nr:hypothetical protein [Clostridium sp.]
MRDFKKIIDNIHKSEENVNFRQKNRIKKEEIQIWISKLLKMVDEAMQSIYENLKENPLDNQGIENISYNMIEGIEDIFRKYLERVSEAMSLGGFSHMYNSYKQLYYNPEELIEIYEKIKNEKVSRKFRMTKNVKANKETVVREVLSNYREISNGIPEEEKRIIIGYKNSNQFRKLLKEEFAQEDINDIRNIGKFVGYEKGNFIEFFKEQKSNIEKNTREAYIQSIIVLINILDQLKLLAKYQREYKQELNKMDLGELAYEINGQGKELGMKELFSEENLKKLPIKTLMAQSAFWSNRLTKEIERMNNAKFICKDLDLINKIVKFRIEKTNGKEELISEDVIEKELEKIAFLNIVIEKIINQVEEDIKNTGIDGEVDIESYIRKISADYQEEYLKHFNKKLPMCNNIIGNDIEQFIVAKNMINNLYKGKSAINFALLEEALLNEKILNWGYIEEEKDEKFVLLGFDIEKLSGPLFLHIPLKEIEEFLERNRLESKIPIYQGENDFKINGKTITRKLLMPIDNGKIKKLEEFKINQTEERDKFNFIEHCKYIVSGDTQKYPKHLKKIKYIGKGKKQKQKLVIEKEYINLETKEKYKKDKDGNFEKIEEYTR